MTDPLSPETIKYIVEWYESGNQSKSAAEVSPELVNGGAVVAFASVQVTAFNLRLNPAGITIARLARLAGDSLDLADDMVVDMRGYDWVENARRRTALDQTRRDLLGE